MKKFALAGLVAAQTMVAAQPTAAANFDELATVHSSSFAGARMRLSLGARPEHRKFRAGLTLVPMLSSRSISGETRMRFGDGLELGFAGQGRPTLMLSGRPVSHLVPGGTKSQDERRLGISTTGYIAIGAGVVALIGAFVLYQDVKDGSLTDCCE